jgi:hypothetical protein
MAAQGGAFARLAQGTARQAFSLAYQDAFFITAVVLAAAAILVWVLPALPRAGASSLRGLPSPTAPSLKEGASMNAPEVDR